jgi:hypothetical protein
MKALTKNLVNFSIFFFMGTVVFRYCLSNCIENRYTYLLWVTSLTYFFFNLFIGRRFGKQDYETLPLYDIAFRFHLATYTIFNGVSVLWFFMHFNSHFEDISGVFITAAYWGIGLSIHFISYLVAGKHTINGIDKEDIFE